MVTSGQLPNFADEYKKIMFKYELRIPEFKANILEKYNKLRKVASSEK